MVNQILGVMQLAGYLLAAVIFGYVSVKLSESQILDPFIDIITKIALSIKNKACDIYHERQQSQSVKHFVNDKINFNTSLEKGTQSGINHSYPVQERNENNCPRSPESRFNLIPKYISKNSFHLKGIIGRVKKGVNRKRGEPLHRDCGLMPQLWEQIHSYKQMV